MFVVSNHLPKGSLAVRLFYYDFFSKASFCGLPILIFYHLGIDEYLVCYTILVCHRFFSLYTCFLIFSSRNSRVFLRLLCAASICCHRLLKIYSRKIVYPVPFFVCVVAGNTVTNSISGSDREVHKSQAVPATRVQPKPVRISFTYGNKRIADDFQFGRSNRST